MGAPLEGNLMAFYSSPGLNPRQQLSTDQQRRIDQNFRAAKAILSRKRPDRDAPTSPLCQPPPTWRPFFSHERNHNAQNVFSHLLENCHGELDLNIKFRMMNTPPAACCNLGKTYDLESTTPHVDPSHFCKDGTKQGLPLNLKDALLTDSDLNESILRKLDNLSEERAPLVELSLNKGAGIDVSRLITEHDSFQLVSTKEDTGAKFCAFKQGQSLERESISSTGSNPSSRTFHAINTCKSFGTSSQLNTGQTIPVLPVLSGLEHSNIHNNLKRLPFDDNQQCGYSDISATGIAPLVASASHSPVQGSMTMTEAVSCPSISIPSLSGSQVSSSTCSEFPVPATEVMPVYLQTLNESQKEAALSDTFRPLLIIAGPGSGKTSTMVARLSGLLNEGVHAKNILAMTFTTAAATEMKDRVGASVGKMISKELNVCTFHSFCLQLCRLHAEKLGRSPEFLVYGHSQQRRAVVEAVRLAHAEIQSSEASMLPVDVVSNISTTAEKGQLSDGHTNPAMCKEEAKKWDKFVVQAKASGKTSEDYENIGNLSGAAILVYSIGRRLF